MKCPLCSGDSSVLQTYNNANNQVRRRRQCDDCGHRFTTKERMFKAPKIGKLKEEIENAEQPKAE